MAAQLEPRAGQRVQVRRGDGRPAAPDRGVVAEVGPADVVEEDEDDVGRGIGKGEEEKQPGYDSLLHFHTFCVVKSYHHIKR